MPHNPARLVRELFQELPFGSGKTDLLAISTNSMLIQVNGELAVAQHQLDRRRLIRGPSQDGGDPGGELIRVEGLRDVVIGAAVQPANGVILSSSSRQKDYWHP